jgi:hypothetical protein
LIYGGGAIRNYGRLIKNSGTSGATISTYMDNKGRVEVDAGTLTLSGAVDQVFNNQLTGGSWTVVGATALATLDISSASFATINPGVTVVVNGPYATFTNLSALTTNEGHLSLLAGASLSTTRNFTNAGVLTFAPSRMLNSVLTINGNFTETPGGSLAVQLGGTTSSPTFGSLTVTGAVSLSGRLTVTSTVLPAVGSSFEILNKLSGSAIGGTFAGLPEGSTFTVQVGTTTMRFQITYVGGNGNDVVIRRTA